MNVKVISKLHHGSSLLWILSAASKIVMSVQKTVMPCIEAFAIIISVSYTHLTLPTKA